MAVEPVASNANISSGASAVPKVEISGLVEKEIKTDNAFFTRIVIKSDGYAKPPVVEVRSERSFGREGSVVKVLCSLGGYVRKSGDSLFVNNTLDYVSH